MVVDSGHNNAGHARDTAGQADEASREPGPGNGSHPFSERDVPDPAKLAQDWITLWQSELAALAADPEMREAWQTTASLWARAMTAMLHAMPRQTDGTRHDRGQDDRYDQSGRRAGTADAPGPPAAAAASDPRDAEIDRLSHQVAALERRLAELGHSGRSSVNPKRRPRRKS